MTAPKACNIPEACLDFQREIYGRLSALEGKVDVIMTKLDSLNTVVFGDGSYDRSLVARLNVLWYSFLVAFSLLFGGGAALGVYKWLNALIGH